MTEEISGTQMNNILREHEQRRSEKRNFISDLEKRYTSTEQDKEDEDEEIVDYGETGRKTSISSSLPSRTISSGYASTIDEPVLPTVNDPSLFLLKCKPGKEKEVALTLMQKYKNYLNNAQPLLITGVVVLDNLSGFIYIEAKKEAHVRKAIEDIEFIFAGKIKKVPINEMTQVMQIPKGSKGMPKPNDWVRMSRGLYKEDLARVLEVDEAKGKITVQLVPRLQFSGQSLKKGQRPPKRLFNKQEIINNGGHVQEKRDVRSGFVDIYEDEIYVEGFLHKEVSVKGIKTKNIDPKLEEIEFFTTGTENIHINKNKSQDFREGDSVRVVEGDMKDLVGIIQSINRLDNIAEILPNNTELGDQLIAVDLNSISFNIDLGSYVQVTSGAYQGETGIVLAVDGNSIVVFSQEKNKEMEVFVSDIKVVSKTTTNESFKEYALHDLVKLNGQTCGIIIHVGNNFFKILDNQGIVKTYKYQELQGKMKKDPITKKDSKGNFISKDSEIRVISGNHAGIEGTVKHIFRNHLFCFSRDVMDNNGLFVTSPMNCEIKGSIVSVNSNSMPAPSKTFARHKITTKKQGQTVRITKGPYKGYIGTVKGAGTNNILRIELHSQPKIVNVEEKLVKVIDTPSQQKSGHIPSSTPSFLGPDTPYSRPGSYTPLHTAQTPLVSGLLPSTPGGWDKNIPNTPLSDRVPESPYHPTTTPGVKPGAYRTYNTPGLPTTTPGLGGYSRLPTTPGISNIVQQRPETPGLQNTNRLSSITPGVQPYGQQRPVTPGVGLGDTRSYGTTPTPTTSITPGYNLGRQNPITPGFHGQGYVPTTPGFGIPSSRSDYPPTPGTRTSIPQTPGIGTIGRMTSSYSHQGQSIVPQTPGMGQVPSTPGISRPVTPSISSTHGSQYNQQYQDENN